MVSANRVERQVERRAEVRHRLMRAAGQLLARSGGTDTTIQEIAAMAGISTKTFYQHFHDKDSFFFDFWSGRLDDLAGGLSQLTDREDDPIARIRAFVFGLFALPDAVPAARGTAVFHLHLAVTAPDKISGPHRPLFDLLVNLIDGARQAGRIDPCDPPQLAGPMLELVVSAVRSHLVGSSVTSAPLSPEDVWFFCQQALHVREAGLG
jgi:AcrR family transcriptional regulator